MFSTLLQQYHLVHESQNMETEAIFRGTGTEVIRILFCNEFRDNKGSRNIQVFLISEYDPTYT